MHRRRRNLGEVSIKFVDSMAPHVTVTLILRGMLLNRRFRYRGNRLTGSYPPGASELKQGGGVVVFLPETFAIRQGW
jgi:hypothetical protein